MISMYAICSAKEAQGRLYILHNRKSLPVLVVGVLIPKLAFERSRRALSSRVKLKLLRKPRVF